jgi:hypothetical protein
MIKLDPGKPTRPVLSDSVRDTILAWQLTIAWAGEGLCEPQRLNWWRTDLVDDNGGGDLFQRLFPNTYAWACLEAVRQAAIQRDQQIRSGMAQPDGVQTLFFWGFDIDEQLSDRLTEHKYSASPPEQCLDLPLALDQPFCQTTLETTLQIPGRPIQVTVVPDGRELGGALPQSPELRVRNLAAALLPLGAHYPMPFYRQEVGNA